MFTKQFTVKFHRFFSIFLFVNFAVITVFTSCFADSTAKKGLPLFYWKQASFENFGDTLSLKLIEKIVQAPVEYQNKTKTPKKKLLAIGSIISFAENDDVIWGSGINGKCLDLKHYKFTTLDVRAVRGPLTRQFLQSNFEIDCPEIYGDPALLTPYFFPEFKKAKHPTYEYIVIPHYSENHLFPKSEKNNIVYSTEPWDVVIQKILKSKFVISSSLHGIIVAEAYGIPARLLKITQNEPLFKYEDYYLGTNRPHFKFASSVEEALMLGGEKPFDCDLSKLFEVFPFEYWLLNPYPIPNFKQDIHEKE